MRPPQASNRPGRGRGSAEDRSTATNGPSQKSNDDNFQSDDSSSQEEESAFSRGEDEDDEDDEEEEEKAPESSTILPQRSSDSRGGRSNFRGRSRGRGYRGNSDSNQRFSGGNRGGRGGHRGYRGSRFRGNTRQSYNSRKPNQDETRKEDASEDVTLETPQVDNHDESQQQEVPQSAAAPRDQRPPREKRATASEDATSNSTKVEEPSTTEPASNGTD